MNRQTDAVRRFAAQRPAEPWRPGDDAVVVIGSGKGGCGGSVISALLALACAREGRRTLLIDADELVGTQHRLFGVESAIGIGALRDGRRAPTEALIDVAEHLTILVGGPGTNGTPEPLAAPDRRALFRRLSEVYGFFDIILVDAGSRLDSVLAAAGGNARRFITVANTDPVALACAYALVKAIDAKWPGAPVELLVNRHDDARGRDAFQHVRSAAERFLGRTLRFAGTIPDDPALTTALHHGAPLTSDDAHTAAGRAAHLVALQLLSEFDDYALSADRPLPLSRRG